MKQPYINSKTLSQFVLPSNLHHYIGKPANREQRRAYDKGNRDISKRRMVRI